MPSALQSEYGNTSWFSSTRPTLSSGRLDITQATPRCSGMPNCSDSLRNTSRVFGQ